MRDAVDSVIEAREALDHGFSGSLLMSGLVHGALVGGAFLTAFLAPKQPLIKIADGFAVQMAGGRGNPNPAPQAPAAPPPSQPAKVEPAAEPEPPPQIAKPPQPTERQGLPDPDVKKPTAKPSAKPEPPRPAPRSSAPPAAAPGTTVRTSGGGGTGTANEAIGLAMMKDGAGVGFGVDTGDYYMAGIQRKIWQIWLQQVKQTFPQPVIVTFTLNPDGSLGNVQVTQSSGVAMLDLAAKRAVMTAAPFSAFPRDYGNSPITINAQFKPTF
ncbi:MAG: TonB family protein [Vicinamibacteria bacterium]